MTRTEYERICNDIQSRAIDGINACVKHGKDSGGVELAAILHGLLLTIKALDEAVPEDVELPLQIQSFFLAAAACHAYLTAAAVARCEEAVH